MLVEFPEYLPDLPALNNPGSTIVNNVIPGSGCYAPLPSLVEYSNALDAYARGAIFTRVPSSGNSVNFAGDGTKLYQLATNTFSNVSKAGNYSLSSDENWEFTQYGSKVLATCINENIQVFDLSSSALFADLSGSPPKARYITSVRDFLMVANTFDGVDGFVPNRVRWCGIGSTTAWTVDPTTQADFQDLDSSYGWITALIGGDYGVVFQERAITRLDYIGSPAIFQFTTVEVNHGTQLPKSVVRVGNLIFYIGIDGFYVFDGARSVPIGENKVDDFFFDDFDSLYPNRISAAVDYVNNLIVWAYPGVGNNGGTPNKLLFYDYSPNASKRWTIADAAQVDLICNMFSQGYTLEQLDSIDSNLDTFPFSLDSRALTGNDLLLNAFTSNHKLANFSGTPYSATIETAEVELNPGQRTNVFLVKPVIESTPTLTAQMAVVTVQIGTRNLQSESVSYGAILPIDIDGNCQSRSNARYHRLRVNISNSFDKAIGFELLDYKKAGKR